MYNQTNEYKVLKASERIQKQAKRNLELNKTEHYKVGEKVRVLNVRFIFQTQKDDKE